MMVPHANTGSLHCDHPDLQKMAYIHLSKKKNLYVKLNYCDLPNKNVEYIDLRITKSWV